MISEFPLFVFTTFAGLSVGTYAAAVLFPAPKEETGKPWLIQVVCLVLLAIGLLGCLMHLGRPERFLNALANPLAGITQEAYLSIAFGCLVLVDAMLQIAHRATPFALRVAGAVFGLALACIMGLAYFESTGVSAWTSWATIPFYLFGDIAAGFALYLTMVPRAASNRAALVSLAAAQTLFSLAAIALAFHFASCSANVTAIAAGSTVSVIAAVAAIVKICKPAGKSTISPALIFAISIIGLAIARYAFYAACPI